MIHTERGQLESTYGGGAPVVALERLEKGGHTQSLMAAPSVSVPDRMGI